LVLSAAKPRRPQRRGGLYDGLKKLNKKNRLFGYLGGPSGLLENKRIEITDKLLASYRNTGGFDIIGSGRTKLETKDSSRRWARTCAPPACAPSSSWAGTTPTPTRRSWRSSSPPAARICVVGCPKTIDGDLKNKQIEVSFGFDTATKVYAELTATWNATASPPRSTGTSSR
jgi:pyrophosphate--fructose-6-phosphate 1-phosphotransferase